MDLSPHNVASASFRIAKKGFDQDEVRIYLTKVAAQLEAAQQQAAAMETRARAAVAKLQELAHQPASDAHAPLSVANPTEPTITEPESVAAAAPVAVASSSGPEESVTIGRALLLAQRTADLALAEAHAEADSIVSAARLEADAHGAAARVAAEALVEAARSEGQHSRDDERTKADEAVQALLARREFLVGDVAHLEQYVGAQRERVRDAAAALRDLADRVPAGLGELRQPLLSASASDASVGDASVGDASVPDANDVNDADANSADVADATMGDAVATEAVATEAPDVVDAVSTVPSLARRKPGSPRPRGDAGSGVGSTGRPEPLAPEGSGAPAIATELDLTQPLDLTPPQGQSSLRRVGRDDTAHDGPSVRRNGGAERG